MAIISNLSFNLIYYALTIGYPTLQIIQMEKDKKTEKIWVLYFLILGLLTILEATALFPIKYILGLICTDLWRTLKMLFCLWAYYPTHRGALLLEKIGGKYIDLAYNTVIPIVGKFLPLAGYPTRQEQEVPLAEKKQQ